MGSVFVSEVVANQLPDEVQLVGEYELKGVDDPQNLYQLQNLNA